MAFYQVEVTDQVRYEIRQLPGHIRQRIFRAIQTLSQEPRPYNSKQLNTAKAKIELPLDMNFYRIRMESWRIVYVIEEELKLVSVLAIRKRPPYDYENLGDLVKNFN